MKPTILATHFPMRHLLSSAIFLGFFSICSHVNAEPTISGLQVETEFRNGSALIIQGAGFGRKSQSAPVLVDYVNEAYENGVKNRVYSSFEDGEIIKAASEFPDSLWGAATSVLPVRYDLEPSNARHPYDLARYHLYGENVWLGRPVAYGGQGGWDTPVNNPQLYLSWWVKVEHNSLYYWRINPYDISGKFEEGESVISNGEVIGEFIGIDNEGLLNFIFPSNANAINLKGVELVGEASKARTIFPKDFRGGSGYGYEAPGTKTLRVWDDPESGGIRTSLSHTDYFLSAAESSYSSNRIYQTRDMVPDVWHHFEVELDVERGTFKSWFNGELGGIAKFDPKAAYEEAYSPTIALIGNNAKQDHLQNMYISEIYMDKSVQRVVIGDAPRYVDLTHYELQRPIKWTDNEIEFAVNLGALASSSELYVYIFDEEGVPNQQGLALCTTADCPVPPQKIQLQVN